MIIRPTLSSNIRFHKNPLRYVNIFAEKRLVSTHHSQLKSVVEEAEKINYVNNISEDVPRPWTEIPGPRRYPLLGSTPSILVHKEFNIRTLERYWRSLFKEFGSIVRVDPIVGPTMVVVWHPDDIEKVYRSTNENPVRLSLTSLKKVRYETASNYFGKKGGILVENDEEWKRVRSKVQTPMMKLKNIIKYLPQVDQITLDFMDIIHELQTEHGEMPHNFLEELYRWALESVGLVALNKRLGCLNKNLPPDSFQMNLIRLVNEVLCTLNDTEMQVKFWKLFPTPSIRRLQRTHDELVEIADKAITETEQQLRVNPNSEDELTLMETLLRIPGLDKKDVVTLVIDMLGTGIDTTSHALAFTLYLLAKNPVVQKRLHEEVDRVLGDRKESITESHLARFSYMKACVKESLRIFPVVIGTFRTLQKDVVLSGYNVPKGFTVLMTNMLTSENESVFPRAGEFLPERWGRDQPLGPIHPYASLPFSHGPRMCLGRRIAEQELYLFLARVMQRYDVNYKYKDMGIFTRLVSVPSEPLKFEFIERKNN